jgi:hypothetical protein
MLRKICLLLTSILPLQFVHGQTAGDRYDHYDMIIGRLEPYSKVNCYSLSHYENKINVYAYEADRRFIDSNTWVFHQHHSQFLIEYNRKNNNEWQLYYDIKHGFPIQSSVIDTLNLDSLATRMDKDWVIPFPLHFESSYIKYIKFPTRGAGRKIDPDVQSDFPKIIFKGSVTFRLCTFTAAYFKNVVFNAPVVFWNNFTFDRYSDGIVFANTEFNDKATIEDDYLSQITNLPIDDNKPLTAIGKDICDWSNRIFTKFFADPIKGIQVQPAYKANNTCVFNGETAIYNNNPFYSFDFSGVTFKGRTYITTLFPDNSRLRYDDKQVKDYPEIIIEPSTNLRFPICNMSFNSANFLHFTSFNNQQISSIDLRYAFFSDTLMVFNTVIYDSARTNGGLYWCHFSKGLDVVLNPSNFELATLRISPVSIDEINFVYCKLDRAVDMDSKFLFDNINSFYNKLINNIKTAYLQDHDLTAQLENKYRHEQLVFKMIYLRKNPTLKNNIELFKLSFLESAVGNGYLGGGNFAVSSLLIILLFALAYYLFYRREFIEYINWENEEKEKSNKNKRKKSEVYDRRNQAKNFAKCFWKSFYIYFSPKFNFSYFNLPTSLWIIVVMEWLIGILMILLFLIYVAATYPFIRNLLGL